MSRSNNSKTSRRSQTKRVEQTKVQRLGTVIRALREERGMSAPRLAKEAGLSRAYLNYLETGKFSEVGLDKFCRLITALDLSADQVLREAGFLPAGAEGQPVPHTYLATQYGLSPSSVEHAIAYLEFLASREHEKVSSSAKRVQTRAKKGPKQ